MDKALMLKRIKEHVGYTKESDFAKHLGISPNVLNNWYSRNTFKPDIVYTKCSGLNAVWLLTGEGEMLLNSEEVSVSGLEKTKECEKCEILEKENDFLKQIIKAKEETIRAYQSNENNNNNKEESKGRNSA
eukprot:TRINITY_DN1533_c0_g2_i1.p1 TRINITY_DN1533_c0_g2~~TRINITY_DN1533_c0_g2_i1.p1  ORF type:complete len:131 (-),score=20.49 TRINITY_DN1533_c0_g2_i1:83-475(-)